jgi:hypothetical protein
LLCRPGDFHGSNRQHARNRDIRSRRVNTLQEIGAATQRMLWTGWSGEVSWSTVLWAVLGTACAGIALTIAMAVNMQVRLRKTSHAPDMPRAEARAEDIGA